MTIDEERIVVAAHGGSDPCRCGVPALLCPNADSHIAKAYSARVEDYVTRAHSSMVPIIIPVPDLQNALVRALMHRPWQPDNPVADPRCLGCWREKLVLPLREFVPHQAEVMASILAQDGRYT